MAFNMATRSQTKFVKEPQQKRPAIEMTDNSAHNESITTLIADIRGRDDPTIKDLIHMFTSYIEIQQNKEKNESEVRERLNETEEKIFEHHDKQISELQETTYDLQIDSTASNKIISATESSLHKLEQLNIDSDVFISPIPFKPNNNELAKKILELTNTSHESIRQCFSFPIKQNPAANSTETNARKKETYAMVIQFKSQHEKMKFIGERKKNGPLKAEQLSTQCPRNNLNDTVNCTPISTWWCSKS